MPSLFSFPPGGPGWRIICAQTAVQHQPLLAELPDEEQQRAISQGHYVQLWLHQLRLTGIELVTVRVVDRLGDRFLGELQSEMSIEGLDDIHRDLPIDVGDTLTFEARHIVRVIPEDEVCTCGHCGEDD